MLPQQVHGALFRSAIRRRKIEYVQPLARILGYEIRENGRRKYLSDAEIGRLWKELSYYGSHNVAYVLRGFVGVDYPEIVRDVCGKYGKYLDSKPEPGDSLAAVMANERLLLEYVFAHAWEHMSDDERRLLLEGMNISVENIPKAGLAAVALILAAKAGEFATYQMAVIVANFIARAVMQQGLSFAANAALTRNLALITGPIGWIVSGGLLLLDLAGPAYRKTIPSVIYVAALRRMTARRA